VRSSFERAYVSGTARERRWYLLRATPRPQPDGGAVIVHASLAPSTIGAVSARFGTDIFQRLADTVPIPIWVITRAGRLTFVNEAWIEATGARESDSEERSWLDVVHPADRATAAAALATAFTRGGRFQIDLRLTAADGTFRWWSLVGAPHATQDGVVDRFVGVCGDLTTARQAQEALQALGSKIVTAQEGERSRIARELHDDLGQQVALLASRLEAIARDSGLSRHKMQAGFAGAWKSVQEIAATVHNLAHQLHPAKLTLLGLVPTLEALCRDVARETSITVTCETHGIPSDLSDTVALCVFRVTQEALQNAAKHSGAERISVTLAVDDGRLRLRVTDDGVGFGPRALLASGLGLRTMRERIDLIGGVLTVQRGDPRGAIVDALIPMYEDTVTA
jgi:PAS domain S-box-containing protein